MTEPQGAVIAAIVTAVAALVAIVLKAYFDKRTKEGEANRRREEEQRKQEADEKQRLQDQRIHAIAAARDFFNRLIQSWIEGTSFRPDDPPDERILGRPEVYEEYLAVSVSWLRNPVVDDTTRDRLLRLQNLVNDALDEQVRNADQALTLAELVTPEARRLYHDREEQLGP